MQELFWDCQGHRGKQYSICSFFVCGNICVRWTQFKRHNRGEKSTPITWIEFKAFLRKNLGKSKSFIGSI